MLDVSANSAGTAARKYKSYQEQFEASQKRVQAAWENIANNKDIQQFLTGFNNFLAGLLKVMPTILKYGAQFLIMINAYKLPGALKGLGNFLLPGGLKTFGQTAAAGLPSVRGRGLWGGIGQGFKNTGSFLGRAIMYDPSKADAMENKQASGILGTTKSIRDITTEIRDLIKNKGVITTKISGNKVQRLTGNGNAVVSLKDESYIIPEAVAKVREQNTDYLSDIQTNNAHIKQGQKSLRDQLSTKVNEEIRKKKVALEKLDNKKTKPADYDAKRNSIVQAIDELTNRKGKAYDKIYKKVTTSNDYTTVQGDIEKWRQENKTKKKGLKDNAKIEKQRQIESLDFSRDKYGVYRYNTEKGLATGDELDMSKPEVQDAVDRAIAERDGYEDGYVITDQRRKEIIEHRKNHDKKMSALEEKKSKLTQEYADIQNKYQEKMSKAKTDKEKKQISKDMKKDIENWQNKSKKEYSDELANEMKLDQDFNKDLAKEQVNLGKDYNKKTIDALGEDGKMVKMSQSDFDKGMINSTQYDDKTGKYRYTKDFVDADGKLHKKGQFAKSSQVNAAKQNQQANADAAKGKAAGAAHGAQVAIQGLAGTLTGMANASTTSVIKDADGKTREYEMSKKTVNASRGTTGIAQGVASMISPVLGQVVGAGMEYAWKNWWGPASDRDLIERQENTRIANETMQVLKKSDNSATNIAKLAKKGISTAEDRSSFESYIDQFTASISGTDEASENARRSITNNLKDMVDLTQYGLSDNSNIYDILNVMEGNQEAQLDLSQALVIAQKKAEHEQLVASKQEEIYNLQHNASEKINSYNKKIQRDAKAAKAGVIAGTSLAMSAAGLGIGGALGAGVFSWLGAAIGAVGGGIAGLIAGSAAGEAAKQAILENQIDTTKSIGAQIEDTKKKLAEQYAKGSDADQKMIAQQEDILDTLLATQAQLEQIARELDVDQMNIAMAGAFKDVNGNGQKDKNETYYANMSTYALKNEIGLDALKAAVINQYLAEGGSTLLYEINQSGEYSSDLESVFQEALSKEENKWLSDLFSGRAYTLSEALALPGQGQGGYTDTILANFVNALGLSSVSELQAQVEKYGDILLSDLLLSNTELSEKIKTINGFVGDWASNSKLIAEKQAEIIDKFPQLVKYLGDTTTMMSEMVRLSQTFADIQVGAAFDSVMTNTGVYDDFLKNLEESDIGADVKKLRADADSGFDKITNLQSLEKWLVNNGYDSGVNKEIYEAVMDYFGDAELISDFEKDNLNTVIEYRTTLMQQELDNLNAQKESLLQINEQRKYENDLVEARLRLENAQKEKKRVWRAGVGWVYEADQQGLKEAQENLDQVTNQKQISELEQQIAVLEQEKNDLESINSNEALETQKALYDAYIATWGENGEEIETFRTDVVGALDGIGALISDL